MKDNLIYNNFMILTILLSPLVLLVCFVLPFIATIFSSKSPQKWIAFWILQIAASWTVLPFLGLFVEEEVLLLFKVAVAVVLIFVLNIGLVTIS